MSLDAHRILYVGLHSTFSHHSQSSTNGMYMHWALHNQTESFNWIQASRTIKATIPPRLSHDHHVYGACVYPAILRND